MNRNTRLSRILALFLSAALTFQGTFAAAQQVIGVSGANFGAGAPAALPSRAAIVGSPVTALAPGPMAIGLGASFNAQSVTGALALPKNIAAAMASPNSAPAALPSSAAALPANAAATLPAPAASAAQHGKTVNTAVEAVAAEAVPAGSRETPSAKVSGLSERLANDIKTAAERSCTPDASKDAGLGIITTITGGVNASAAASAAVDAQAAPIVRSTLLEQLGLREKILTGAGIKTDGEGRILPVEDPVKLNAYDNDDNIAYYRTHIYIQHKRTKEEVAVPTAEFAEVRTAIGKSGKYQDYEYFNSDAGGSFRDFRDVNDPAIFAKDAADAIDSTKAGMFRGPAWMSFAKTMKSAKTAAWAAIVTSRGHTPANMAKGFDVFRQRGYLAQAPRPEMIFGVNSDALVKALPKELGTPEKKIEALIALLDLVESIPLVHAEQLHSFSFSDDDLDMITRVEKRLIKEQAEGRRWPHVKISVISTGLGNENETRLLAGQNPAAALQPAASIEKSDAKPQVETAPLEVAAEDKPLRDRKN